MKRTTISLLVFGLAVAFPAASAAMNNQDVLKMQKAGLSEETILAAMQKERPEYDTSTDALIALKGAGVPEKIIQAIVGLRTGNATGPAPAPSPVPPPPPAPVSAPAAAPAAGGGSLLVPAPSPSAPSTLVPPDEAPQFLPSIAQPPIQPEVGKDYFTRFTFHEEKNEHNTTNYARGPIVPINTPVKVISMSGSLLVLKRGDTGADLKVKNEPKYTKKSIAEIASLMLSAEMTPLEKLPEAIAMAIRSGEMRKGMTKELVLMARGYPPAHETPSTENDRWTYWSSRFVKHTIIFTDGRLTDGRGLQ